MAVGWGTSVRGSGAATVRTLPRGCFFFAKPQIALSHDANFIFVAIKLGNQRRPTGMRASCERIVALLFCGGDVGRVAGETLQYTVMLQPVAWGGL